MNSVNIEKTQNNLLSTLTSLFLLNIKKTTAFVAMIIVLAIIPLFFTSIFGNSTFSSEEKTLLKNKNTLISTIQTYFPSRISKSDKEALLKIINEKYNQNFILSNCSDTASPGFQINDGESIVTITLNFNSRDMSYSMLAYFQAVNNVLNDFREGEIPDDELLVSKKQIQDYFNTHSVLVVDKCIDRWNMNVSLMDDTRLTGTISINAYYDVSDYEKGQLDELRKFDDSISEQLQSHFDGYFVAIELADSAPMPDYRNKVFGPLLSSGSLFYLPLAGLGEQEIPFEKKETGDIGRLISGSENAVWNQVETLKASGELSLFASPKNCTEFANYWFYRLYGNGWALRGNGGYMVDYLMKTTYGKQHFTRSISPSVGAIFSISSMEDKVGHVGGVDAIDYEKRTITISHGNYGHAGAVILHREMSFADFQALVNNYGTGAQIIFACPIPESFANEDCAYQRWLEGKE